ncbi:L,D-transpeptidase family protein [Marivirga sp. S37H4]|uniref:L,D-transpeptidase family protein n=1 Tax=Marivirga aurantiaca TaxID=2802615 RepID=A0A934X2V6_9BACT|nr:L,D-transpeptidase family protein [Marivirga aurantiaca]MBK6267365.1 L,D-transpeptidase family protein [Marivirga aurantiaca]
MNLRFFIAFYFLLYLLTGCDNNSGTGNQSKITKDSEAISLADTTPSFFEKTVVLDTARQEEISSKVSDFYRKNGGKTRWFYATKKTSLFTSLVDVLSAAEDYGLDPALYRLNHLKDEAESIYNEEKTDTRRISKLDRDATASFILFITHLKKGRIANPGRKEWIWLKDEVNGFAIPQLLEINDQSSLNKLLDTLQPRHSFYVNLRDQLKKLNHSEPREIIEFSMKNLDDFEIGYEDENVKYIRNNLNQWGIETEMGAGASQVDSTLIEKIKDFQRSFSIKVDGLPGTNTLKYLNMGDEELKKLIALNLERMRWLPEDMEGDMVLVNVPEFKLRAYKGGELQLKMKVIVGEEYNATPIFSDTLKYIEFGPTWTVPQSIIKEEMIPKLKEDPGYYIDRDFKVYENEEEVDPYLVNWESDSIEEKYFKVVQQPSTSNALGLVKFIMPNSLAIYLHDTPESYLFDEKERTFSHGCIRLEYPQEFAYFLLRDQGDWDKDKISKMMVEGETEKVYLEKPYHVQIAYLTTWVDKNGALKIFEDIYGFDEIQLKKLEELSKYAKSIDNEYS